jgi:hypothetical protein
MIAPAKRKQSSGMIAWMPVPPRFTKRKARQKCVSGNACERMRTPGGN